MTHGSRVGRVQFSRGKLKRRKRKRGGKDSRDMNELPDEIRFYDVYGDITFSLSYNGRQP